MSEGVMRLLLSLYVESRTGLRVYQRVVDRNYARVPVAGESVFVDDLGGHVLEVSSVLWSNDDSPILEFRIDHGDDDSHTWATAAGYQDVTATAPRSGGHDPAASPSST